MKARRLSVIAEWINTNRPELRAVIERGHASTDSKIPGTRLIRKGKGRRGNRLKVYRWRDSAFLGPPKPILDHNAAETYRSNEEVETWLAKYLKECAKGKHRTTSLGADCDTCGEKLRERT